MYTLRTYQERGKTDIVNFFKQEGGSRRGVAVAPCAAGKSLYIGAAANEIDSPQLILQPSKELLVQNYQKYISYGNEASIFSASLNSKEIGHVTFATPGSIAGQAEKFKQLGVKYVYQDECHYNARPGSQVDGFMKGLHRDAKLVGLTASPVILRNGMYGAELKMLNRTHDSIFNSIIHCTQIKEVVDGGFWCGVNYEIHRQSNSTLRKNTAGSEFTDASLKDYFYENKLEEKILETVERVRKERDSILIFVPTIEEAEKLANKIPGAAYVHSKISQSLRDGIVKGFKNGFIKVVVNVNVLATGYDHPELSCVINSAPTMSIARYYQQTGRGVRIAPGKQDCLIVDFSGNFDRFGRLEGLMFEELPEAGWHMTNNGKVLTAGPIQGIPPTKEQLIEEVRLQKQARMKAAAPITTPSGDDVILWFGKYTNRKLSSLKSPEEIQYLQWMNANFNFNGQKMSQLKGAIEKVLVNLRTP